MWTYAHTLTIHQHSTLNPIPLINSLKNRMIDSEYNFYINDIIMNENNLYLFLILINCIQNNNSNKLHSGKKNYNCYYLLK